ncbi:PRD domain-containing protein [Lactococcus lactis]|uniref:BglG family transcription antiterminator n=1 Tax=Lactococcus lactis TaxID=1358 RepID=UPI002416EE98|nr:PRD domain-containing protein [Lactococcus lactis]MDG4975088.1 PRD domain-containing protein [Lactococcus lactis]
MISVKKVLNSSVVLVEKGNQEFIVLGRGIGYARKAGSIISDDEIDKIFIPMDRYKSSQFVDLLNEIPIEYFEMTKDIVNLAEEELKLKLNPNIYLTLADHLSFAVERQKKGLSFTNRLQWELENYYPKEFVVGKKSLKFLYEKYNLDFNIEEAANIAFHLVNAQDDLEDGSNGFKKAKLIASIVNLIKYALMSEIDTSSIHYSRFIAHVRYFVDRLFSDQLMVENNGLYKQMWELYPMAMSAAIKVGEYIMQTYSVQIPENELAYLGVHINRLWQYSTYNRE